MKCTAILLATVLATTSVLSADKGDNSRPRRESEDPSYEPARNVTARGNTNTKVEKRPAAETPAPVLETQPIQAEVQTPSGPQVKYILDGKPYYDDPPKIGAVENDSATPRQNVKTPAPSAPAEIISETPSAPRVKYILDGKAYYEGDPLAVTPSVRSPEFSTTPPPTSVAPVAPAAAIIETDLIGDKPGTATAAAPNQLVLEEMTPIGRVSTSATKCFALLKELKENVETVNRCLNDRGKENARLIHAADEASKNISDIAEIWPKSDNFRDKCATMKRLALIVNEELSQTPWRWAQVRWSFDAFLKDIRGFREYARAMADAEPSPIAVVGKNGQITYQDAPPPVIDQLGAQIAAKRQAEQDAIRRIKNTQEVRDDDKKTKLDIDLDGTKTKSP